MFFRELKLFFVALLTKPFIDFVGFLKKCDCCTDLAELLLQY